MQPNSYGRNFHFIACQTVDKKMEKKSPSLDYEWKSVSAFCFSLCGFKTRLRLCKPHCGGCISFRIVLQQHFSMLYSIYTLFFYCCARQGRSLMVANELSSRRTNTNNLKAEKRCFKTFKVS